jgi:propionate CoA-transferase
LRGPGGFLDIAHKTRTVLFCGTLTAGGLHVSIDQSCPRPSLIVVKEGRNRKFLKRLGQVNFHGPTGCTKGQRVLVITERAVFRVTEAGLELVEIAPGIDIERDIRPALDCAFTVSARLCEMDHRLFRDEPMGLTLSAAQRVHTDT